MPAAGWILCVAITVACFAFVPKRGGDPTTFALVKEAGVAVAALTLALISPSRAVGAVLLGALALIGTWTAGGNVWLGARPITLLVSLAILARGSVALGEETDRVLEVAGVAAVCVASLVCLQSAGLLPDPAHPGVRPGALVGNRNAAAHIALLALPLGWRLLGRGRWPANAPGFAGVALATAAIAISRSRTTWLASVVVLATLLTTDLTVRPPAARERRRAALYLAAVVAGVLLASAIVDRMSWTSDGPWRDTVRRLADLHTGSGYGRLRQALTDADIIAGAPWLGVGAGNWQRVYPRYARVDDPSVEWGAIIPVDRIAQSDWLALAVEFGLPATLAGVLLWTFAVKRCIAMGREARRPRGRRAPFLADNDPALRVDDSVACLAILLSTGVAALGDPVMQTASIAVPTVISGACLWSLASGGARNRRSVTVRNRRGVASSIPTRIATCVATAAAAALALGRLTALLSIGANPSVASFERAAEFDPANARFQVRAALLHVEGNRCDLAIPRLERGLRLMPSTPAALSAYSACVGDGDGDSAVAKRGPAPR